MHRLGKTAFKASRGHELSVYLEVSQTQEAKSLTQGLIVTHELSLCLEAS